MTTTELDELRQSIGVEQALQNLAINPAEGDTGLRVQNEITDGTKVSLTSMVDGLPRPAVPLIHARRALKKYLDEAKTLPAFWIPGLPYHPPQPVIGTIKCMLHPEFDESNGPAGIDRAFVDAAGLTGFFCNRGDPSKNNKADFTSVFDRDQHMKHKHKTQWELIDAAINKDEERDEKTQRQLDREVLMALARAAGGQPQAAPTITATPEATIVTLPLACDICGREFKDNRGIAAHLRLSRDEAHQAAREG